jgi:photosystem II cytochrome c550
MRQRSFWFCLFITACAICLQMSIATKPAWAAIDPYVTRYLKVTESVPLEVDEQGHTRLFSPEDLSAGKQLFESSCLNCHVGGTTLPDPTVPLSLTALKGASPRRDTINGLVAFLRQPMTYDGSEETPWCRQVPETWLSQEQVERLAGFVLRAAQIAPGWGKETFQGE